MNRTKRRMQAVVVAVAMTIGVSGAWAELCAKCKDGMYTADSKRCPECKQGWTASGVFQLCEKCSAQLGQCERCRDKLEAVKKPSKKVANPLADAKTKTEDAVLGKQAGKQANIVNHKPWEPQQAKTGNSFFLRAGDRIMLLGNSITEKAAPEVEFIQQDLKQHHPALGAGDGAVSFSNVGTSGWQAWQGLEKLKEYLAKNKPTVCVIGYGTCEVTFQNQKSYVPAMKAIVKQLRAAGVAVTIVAPPPPSPGNWKQSFPLAHFVQGLPEMGKLARQVAEEESVPFVDTQAAFAPLVKAGQEFTTDGIHLNSAGYRVMAEALLECWSREKR